MSSIECCTVGGKTVTITKLNDLTGLVFPAKKRGRGIRYDLIALMLQKKHSVFLSGEGINGKNITWIRKRIEKELEGLGVEASRLEWSPANYVAAANEPAVAGYVFYLKNV